MSDINNKLYNIRRLDEIGEQSTFIHSINSMIKIIVTLLYIIKVISIDTVNLKDILILLVYPLVIFIVGKINFLVIAKKLIIVLPLILGIVTINMCIGPTIYQFIKSILLILKSILTVFGGLLLLASTGMNNISIGLRKMKVPNIFVIQLMMLYRYIIVMLEEAHRIKSAYSLRNGSNKGINILDFGTIIGQMLLRAIDRGENVYGAMKLRGYDGNIITDNDSKISYIDIIYLLFWIILFFII